jgi:carboxyl-terminal processing protease
MNVSPLLRPLVAALALVAVCLTTLPAMAAPLGDQLAGDVNRSYVLLEQTYYKDVDRQTIIDAARNAIADTARKHGVRMKVAAVRASDDDRATLDSLDAVISDAADTTHAPATEFAYAAIAAMAKAVNDRWTTFMSPDDYKAFKDALDPEKISGIGVLITPDVASGLMSVSFVVPGTPADRAGLQPGDLITTIDGASSKGLTIEAASKLLRGRAGSVVHLAMQRGAAAPTEVMIVRLDIQPPTVIYKMLPGNIGYVWVLAFGQDTPEQFDTALQRLKDLDAKAYVLDLRDDGGGYVESALEISSRFIAERPLVTVQERGLPDKTYDAHSDVMVDVPVTVLVNENTASASEITAGALQDDGIAQLIGSRTFGKGVMQTLTELPDGAAIKITTAHYLTPSKRDINLKGIDPDLRVGENKDPRFGDVAHDAQLRAAIDMLQKKIAAVVKP